MLKGFDQAELLELIEGELDPKRAAALRSQLAKNPSALEWINRLRADRALLQSCRQPDLPRDFLAEIEPLVARPLLRGTPPGEYRRRQRRMSHRPVWARVAAVAAVMLIFSGALWATLNVVLNSGSEPGMIAAVDDDVDASPAARGSLDVQPDQAKQVAAMAPTPVDPAEGIVHHYAPTLTEPMVASASSSETDLMEMRSAPRVRRAAADFALVVLAADSSQAEQALVSNLEDWSMPAALVRNFSVEEAEALAEQWRIAHGRNRAQEVESDPVMVDVGGGRSGSPRLERLARQAQRQLQAVQELSGAAGQPQFASGQLLGPPELAPSFRQQLDFTSRGATMTITVPMADLPALLERLAMDEAAETALRMLPDSARGTTAVQSTDPMSVRWLADAPRVQASLRRLQQAGEDVVVELPVIVEIARGR